MLPSRPKIGDLVEIRTNRGYAYALYTHEHKMFGSLLRVYGHVFTARPNHFETILTKAPQFETFFPLSAAVRKRLVSIIGQFDIPEKLKEFPIFRDGVADPKTGKVQSWWLWDGRKEWQVGRLNDEQKKYPVRSIINDTLLKERIESGWTSANEI